MSDLVKPSEIEKIVGVERHPVMHFARAVSAENKVYILHSQQCLDSGIDLRKCEYSLALDNGIEPEYWEGFEDQPVPVGVTYTL